jgi:hypothetical protein
MPAISSVPDSRRHLFAVLRALELRKSCMTEHHRPSDRRGALNSYRNL